jgi:hypothetical protein
MKCATTIVTAPVEILANDHYVAVPYTVSDTGVTADAYGKKTVPAGTILPANDATAVGVLLHDTDVTYGARADALVIHGFIKTAKLPVAPATTAIAALKQISFLA